DERTQLLLPGEHPTEHVPYIKGSGSLDTAVLDGGANGSGTHLTQIVAALFHDRGLAATSDEHVTHTAPPKLGRVYKSTSTLLLSRLADCVRPTQGKLTSSRQMFGSVDLPSFCGIVVVFCETF